MHTYILFLLLVSSPALIYAAIHRRMLQREFGYRLFPAFILWQALVFFVVEILALTAGWWGVYSSPSLGLTILGVPIEELVFFVLIPQVSLLVWALARRPDSWQRARYMAGHHLRQWRKR